MASRVRVVVTGLGIVSPVGSTTDKAWQNIAAGNSGISKIDCFDASEFSVQIAGQTRDFNADDYLSKKRPAQNGSFYSLRNRCWGSGS